jgi:hypothetical protein
MTTTKSRFITVDTSMEATRISVGRFEFGWSRYYRPKTFSIVRYMPGFWRFRWRTLRVYIAWHRLFTEPYRAPAEWGGDP